MKSCYPHAAQEKGKFEPTGLRASLWTVLHNLQFSSLWFRLMISLLLTEMNQLFWFFPLPKHPVKLFPECTSHSLSAFAVCPNHWGWHYAYFNTVQMEICIYKSFPYLHFQVAGLTCWGCSIVDELSEASAALRGRLIRIRDCCASQLSTFWVSETLILTHR